MNTNMLEGMKCPKCGSEGPFRIVIEATALIFDEGVDTDEVEWVSWHKHSGCQCANLDCEFMSTAENFGFTGD